MKQPSGPAGTASPQHVPSLLLPPRPRPCTSAPPTCLAASHPPAPRGLQVESNPGGPAAPAHLPTRPPEGRPRSVLFTCCFNLLSFFTSPFREGAAAAPSCRLSVCVSWAGWGLGQGAPWTERSGCWGRGGSRPMQRWQATVNFKEFLQDIFINFFSWLFLEKGVGGGDHGAGLGFESGSYYTHAYKYI